MLSSGQLFDWNDDSRNSCAKNVYKVLYRDKLKVCSESKGIDIKAYIGTWNVDEIESFLASLHVTEMRKLKNKPQKYSFDMCLYILQTQPLLICLCFFFPLIIWLVYIR